MITFENVGSLTNPTIESPYYIESDSKIDALMRFLSDCAMTHKLGLLSPTNIRIETVVVVVDKINKMNL